MAAMVADGTFTHQHDMRVHLQMEIAPRFLAKLGVQLKKRIQNWINCQAGMRRKDVGLIFIAYR